MATLLSILSGVTLVGFIIGLFKPSAVVLWKEPEARTRGQSALVYGVATIVISVIYYSIVPGTP